MKLARLYVPVPFVKPALTRLVTSATYDWLFVYGAPCEESEQLLSPVPMFVPVTEVPANVTVALEAGSDELVGPFQYRSAFVTRPVMPPTWSEPLPSPLSGVPAHFLGPPSPVARPPRFTDA